MPETCIMFGKIGARVMVEGKEVQHYGMHADLAKKEVSCWIASEAGKTFEVIWMEHETDFPLCGRLYLDGHKVKGKFRIKNTGPIAFQNISITSSSVAPYLFSPLVVTDDDTFLDSSSSVGEIKFVVHRITAPVLISDERHVRNMLPQPQKVHERSKKAIAHQVTYGNEIYRVGNQNSYNYKTTERLVTFVFKYRPLEMLQANEIAPRNSQPLESQEPAHNIPSTSMTSSRKRKHSKVKEEFDSEGESEDEDSKRERALLAELEGIRQARHSKCGAHLKKKTKKESKALFIPGEIIDLT